MKFGRRIKRLIPLAFRPTVGYLYDYASWLAKYRKSFLAQKTFISGGVSYSYFVHHYNQTWANERAVEIPVIWREIAGSYGKKILEIGNVLSHYFDVSHVVVDKDERSKYRNVVNVDILDYSPNEKFDLIVSISTFEHIGLAASRTGSNIVMEAVKKTMGLLKPDGKAIITIPVGYNVTLDAEIRERRLRFAKCQCMRRISAKNEWEEISLSEVLQYDYAKPFAGTNGIIIGWLNLHGSTADLR